MKVQDKLIKQIALTKHKDPRVIQNIVYHPFLFAKKIMADPDDERPIRIRYFGVLVQKYILNKSILKKMRYIHTKLLNDPRALVLLQEQDPTLTDVKIAWLKIKRIFDDSNKKEIVGIFNLLYKAMENQ